MHQAFLPQSEDTFIHNVQLTQLPDGKTYETLISLPRVHFFELPQIDLPYEVDVLVQMPVNKVPILPRPKAVPVYPQAPVVF